MSLEKSEAESSSDWELGCSADVDGASVAGEENMQSSVVGVYADVDVTGKVSVSNLMVKIGGSTDSFEDMDAMLL